MKIFDSFNSVAVCAKESDGGVHPAIRSLVRYLLEKRMPKRVKKTDGQNANLKNIFSDPSERNRFLRNLANIDDHTYEHMKLCNIPEVLLCFDYYHGPGTRTQGTKEMENIFDFLSQIS